MSYVAWDEFWWTSITGAHSLVSSVASGLLEGKNVILGVPPDFPWLYSMRSAISTLFQEKSDLRDTVIETIDMAVDNPDSLAPGKLLLSRFASIAVRNGYRERSQVTIQDYIRQKDVMKNRIVWVKGLSAQLAEEWVTFCRGFSPRSTSEGLLVLEVQGQAITPETRYFRAVDFNDCVSSYDVQLFNSFILDSRSEYTENWKKYIAAVVASVCGTDAELSELLIQKTDFKYESPISGIKRIAEMPDYEGRGANEEFDHVLWYYKNQMDKDIEHRIWSAQIQILFPIIEMERIRLIQNWYPQIEESLNTMPVQQYGETIRHPMDVELGTLIYMMSYRTSADLYLLYIPSEQDRNRIRFLHECRNLLAHVNCCSPEQVAELLDYIVN